MFEVTRENLLRPLSEEDSFSLKIIADRYLLKDSHKEPKRDSVVVAEFIMEGMSQAGYNTAKEVCIVDSYDKDTEMVHLTIFTGPERGDQVSVPRKRCDLLMEPDVPALKKRVAKALSGGNHELEEELEKRVMDELIFGGRILAGAGTDEELTYFNCYVVPFIHDSRGGIAKHREIVMEIMSRGGGVGTNGSTLRPAQEKVHKVRGRSSGAVSWLDDLSSLTNLVQQGGSRRGAQMICLADFHPDLIEFITAKAQKPLECTIEVNGEKQHLKFGSYGNKRLEGANISVLFSNKFMEALKKDEMWELRFPDVAQYNKREMDVYDALWDQYGDPEEFHKATGLPIKVHARIPARDIARLFAVAMHGSAEPGALFLERANEMSNSWYFNPLIATNPCGEQFLAKWAVCNLGHVNLAHKNHLMFNPNTGKYEADLDEIAKTTEVLTRALDNVIDTTPYYFQENEDNQRHERRLGLGTMGIDELLKLEGLDYGTQEGRDRAEQIFELVTITAYETSIDMAKEKGPFRNFELDKYLQSGFIKFLEESGHVSLIHDIKQHGIRNVTIVTQAPTGTTGTLAQTSTGIEPFFAGEFWRSSRIGVSVQKAPVIKRMEQAGMDTSSLKYAGDYTTKEHLDFQAVAQKWNDSSISKTINAPRDTTVDDVVDLLEYAYDIGLKGFTMYVDGSRETQVLGTSDGAREATQELTEDTFEVKTALGHGSVTFKHDDEMNLVSIEVNVSEVKDTMKTQENLPLVIDAMIESATRAKFSDDCHICGAPLRYEEGCFKCEACGMSKCG